jgi:hypothetical protein
MQSLFFQDIVAEFDENYFGRWTSNDGYACSNMANSFFWQMPFFRIREHNIRGTANNLRRQDNRG